MKNSIFLISVILGTVQYSYSQECCFNIGSNSFVRNYNPIYGCWMQDPLETDGAGKIYAMPSYNNQNVLYEYASMTDFTNNNVAQTYTLPYGYAGTGHVVYGGNLYYNKYGSGNMIKWDISTQNLLQDVLLPSAGTMNTYHYQWGGYSDIDFAIDETSLWVLYSTASNSGKLVV